MKPENPITNDQIDDALSGSTPIARKGKRWRRKLQKSAPALVADVASKGIGLIGRRFADIESLPIDWLWPGRIARGKLTMIAGQPGLGKSMLTCEIAARLSRGAIWPDGAAAPEPADTIMFGAEDGAEDTVRPRLEAADADLSRIHMIDGVQLYEGPRGEREFDLADHVDQLRAYLLDHPAVQLVVIDPITSFVSGIDGNSNTDIRNVLRPLTKLAAETGVSILAVSHLNKGQGAAVNRVLGSVAWVAASRAVWAVVVDPDDQDARLFLPLKNNIAARADGLRYRVQPWSSNNDVGKIVWSSDPVNVSADEALAQFGAADQGERSSLDAAVEFLRIELADGPVRVPTLQALAKDAGVSWRTAERAKSDLGVIAEKSKFEGGWTWRLPAEAARPSAPPVT